MNGRFLWLCLMVVCDVGSAASAGSVSLVPVKDNTLIQWSPGTAGANPLLSNGLGDIFVGRTNQDGQGEATISIRRGLVQFDVAEAIPNGATVTSVTLMMRDVMGLNGDPTVSLHTVLQGWGEGTSFFPGGQGAAATDGDATWLHAIYDADDPQSSSFWSTPGGDYSLTVSASSIVFDDAGGGQLFSWSGAGLVADVQNWVSNPASNFGWLLLGDESRGQSAKRLNSSESITFPNVPPQLTIEYVFAGDYNNDGAVDAADYVVWRKLLDTTGPLPNETVTPGQVGSQDYDVWVAEFGGVLSGESGASEVPEPEGLMLLIGGGVGGVLLSLRVKSRSARGTYEARRSGFTLVELLTAIALIGVLIAIILPAIQAAREAARRTQCVNQLRQLGVAASNHVSAKGHFPAGVEQWYFNTAVSHRGIPLFAFLLPYFEEANALVDWDYDDPMNNANQGPLSKTAIVLPILLCPSDVVAQNPIEEPARHWVYAIGSYGGNGGSRSYFPQQSTADGMFHTTGEASEPVNGQLPVWPRHVSDGLSKTLLFGERSHDDPNYKTFNAAGWGEPLEEWGWWGASTSRKMVGHVTMSAYAPLNYRLPFSFADRQGQTPSAGSFAAFQHYVDLRVSAFGSNHPGGANFCYADGSCRWVADDISHELLQVACTRAAGN